MWKTTGARRSSTPISITPSEIPALQRLEVLSTLRESSQRRTVHCIYGLLAVILCLLYTHWDGMEDITHCHSRKRKAKNDDRKIHR